MVRFRGVAFHDKSAYNGLGMKTSHGFKLSAVAAGRKKKGLDLGMIASDPSSVAAAVFTRNAFPAAPVFFSRESLQRSGHRVRAVSVNSGNANAATGEEE